MAVRSKHAIQNRRLWTVIFTPLWLNKITISYIWGNIIILYKPHGDFSRQSVQRGHRYLLGRSAPTGNNGTRTLPSVCGTKWWHIDQWYFAKWISKVHKGYRWHLLTVKWYLDIYHTMYSLIVTYVFVWFNEIHFWSMALYGRQILGVLDSYNECRNWTVISQQNSWRIYSVIQYLQVAGTRYNGTSDCWRNLWIFSV